jgi:hypothetical protein
MAEIIKSGPVTQLLLGNAVASVAAAETNFAAINANLNIPANYTDLDASAITGGIRIDQVGDSTAFSLSDEVLSMASGYDKNCLQRHTLDITVYQPNPWLLLNDAQVNNVLMSAQVIWSDGDTSTWNDARMTVVPILSPIANLTEVGYSTTATTDPTTFGSFTTMGSVHEDAGSSVTPNTKQDGAGRQMYVSTSLEHTVMLQHIKWSDGAKAAIDDGAVNAISFVLPDGTSFGYRNVYTEMRRSNKVGLSNARETQLVIKNGFGDFASSLKLPGEGVLTGTAGEKTFVAGTLPTMADCVFGLQISLDVSGLTESDFYKES